MWTLERCYERVLSIERHGRLHEEGIRLAYEAILTAGEMAIDGGAHSGKHTLPLAAAVGKQGRVVAFEPSPEPFARLRSALDESGTTNVTAINKALSDTADADVSFLVFPDRPGVSGFTRRSDAAGKLPSHEISVATTTIDEIDMDGARVGFIKLDVEGAELRALHGAQRVVATHQPVIHVEASYVAWDAYGYGPRELLDFAARHGYRVVDVIGIELADVASLDTSFRTRGVWDYMLVPTNDIGDRAVQTLRQHAADSFGVDTWPASEKPSSPVHATTVDPQLPLISVVVPFYRDAPFIDDCLRSICSQQGVEIEIVTVDDRGDDGSADIVETWQRADPRVRLIRHDQNRGLAAARNTGTAFATGDMIAYLDADDFYYPDSLVTRARRLEWKSRWDSTVAGSYCGSEMVPEDTPLTHEPSSRPSRKRLSYLGCRGENPVIATAPMLWRSAVLDVGGFAESFPTAEDFEFWMRLLRQGYELVPTGHVGVAYRQKQSGMISEGLAKHAANARRVYDYVHRPLAPEEVSARAPGPHLLSLGGHQERTAWIRRVATFVTLAVGSDNDVELDGLLAQLPSDAGLHDLRRAGVRQVFDSAVRRFELKHGPLTPVERDDLIARTLDILTIEMGARPRSSPTGPSALLFDIDGCLARGAEPTLVR